MSEMPEHDDIPFEPQPVLEALIYALEEIAHQCNADPEDRPDRYVGELRQYQGPGGAVLQLDGLDGLLGMAFREMKASDA